MRLKVNTSVCGPDARCSPRAPPPTRGSPDTWQNTWAASLSYALWTAAGRDSGTRLNMRKARFKHLLLFLLQVTLSRHVNSHFKNPTGSGTAGSPSGPSQKRQSAPSSPLKFYIRKNRRKTLRSSRDQAEASVPASGPDLFHIGIMAGIKDGLSRFSSASNRSSSLSPSSLDLVFTNGGELVFRPGSVKSRKLDEDGNIQYLVSWHPGGM